MNEPDVFLYTDFRRYLDDWFTWRKTCNRRYSHRAFVKKLGKSDPSLLINIVKGRRRLPKALLDDFVRVLGLRDENAACFRLLVRFGQARDEQVRDQAWAELSELRARLRKPELDEHRLRYVSEMRFPALRSLAECEGFLPDPAWMGSHLRPPISSEAAAEALALLEHLGLVRRDGDAVHVEESMVRTDTEVENLGSLAFHAQSLAHAGEVLEQVRLGGEAERQTAFVATTLAVPSERLNDLRALIYTHLQQIMHTCESWSGHDRAVQISVQMFPVSESTRDG